MTASDGKTTVDKKDTARRRLWQKLRAYFLTGLVVSTPVAITFYIIWLVIAGIDRFVRPLIPAAYNPETYLPFSLPGLGVALLFVFITLLGALTANFFGRYLLRIGERVLDRMPVVRSVYSTLKQIVETIASKSSRSFKHVVLIEYPRQGLWAIAFVTSETSGEIHRRIDADMVNVFLPTTPNPTSGFLLFVPRKDVIYLDMTVEEGIRKVISAGLVTPKDPHPAGAA